MNFSSYASYRQKRQHGTSEFPVAYFYFPTTDSADTIPLHWHPECELIHVIEGTMDISLDGTLYHVPADNYFLIYGEYFHNADIANCIQETIVFSSDRLFSEWPLCRKEREELDNRTRFLKPFLSSSPALHAICQELFGTLGGSQMQSLSPTALSSDSFDVAALADDSLSAGNRFRIIGLLYQLFGTLFAEGHYAEAPAGQLSGKSMQKLKSALSYMEEHLAEPVTLDDLAHAAGLNAKYLCRLFKSATLSTPMEYLNRCRIDHACQLLLTTDETVTQIAFRCGFNDTSYFIRLFKRYKNQTPSAYARKG